MSEDYTTKVLNYLKAMQPGTQVQLSSIVKDENREQFLAIVAEYMHTVYMSNGIELTPDGNAIRKQPIFWMEEGKQVTNQITQHKKVRK